MKQLAMRHVKETVGAKSRADSFQKAKEDVVLRSKAKKAGTIAELVVPPALKKKRVFKKKFKTLETEEEICSTS